MAGRVSGSCSIPRAVRTNLAGPSRTSCQRPHPPAFPPAAATHPPPASPNTATLLTAAPCLGANVLMGNKVNPFLCIGCENKSNDECLWAGWRELATAPRPGWSGRFLTPVAGNCRPRPDGCNKTCMNGIAGCPPRPGTQPGHSFSPSAHRSSGSLACHEGILAEGGADSHQRPPVLWGRDKGAYAAARGQSPPPRRLMC